MDGVFLNWMNQMWEFTRDPAFELMRLGEERDAIMQQSFMEAGEYVLQHISWNDQTAWDMIMEYENNYDYVWDEEPSEYIFLSKMVANVPSPLPKEKTSTVSLFGLDKLKMEGMETTLMEIPNISFSFNEEYVMNWMYEMEVARDNFDSAVMDSVMQLADGIMNEFAMAAER